MFATPFLIAASARVAERLPGRALPDLDAEHAAELAALSDHVIIVGYGVNGRNLARALRAAGIRYVILEQNGPVVREARRKGEPIFFGDGSRRAVLHEVGLERARVLVLAISSPEAERCAVAVARDLSRTTRIVVRTRYVAEIEELSRLGADDVVPEEFETSLEIFARVLRLYGIPSNVIAREIDLVRGEHYGMMRGLALPALRLHELKHLGVHAALDTVRIEAGALATGRTTESLRMRQETGATLIAVVRDGAAVDNPSPQFVFEEGDTVVLVGDREALDRGIALFRAARPGR
jgi:CPA2 family monovalent cation:H+ antiporter-2